MEKALENLDNVIEKISDESVREQLGKARKVISQNRKKIWLRTKTGKPMAEETQAITEKIVSTMEGSEEMESVLSELEAQAGKIREESRRRSMVVT
jgi:Tfp pilus assembly protein FimV